MAQENHTVTEKDAEHPVSMTYRGDGSVEWVTVDYAVNKLSGYYRDDPEGWIESALRAGAPLQTMAFYYQMPVCGLGTGKTDCDCCD